MVAVPVMALIVRAPTRAGKVRGPAGRAAAVGHVAAHELGAAAYAIKAAQAVAPADDLEAAGRGECQWQRSRLPLRIRELVLDDQRLRNELCWFAFDC